MPKPPKDLAEKITIRFDGEFPNYCSWDIAKRAAIIFCKMKLEGIGEGLDLNIEDEKIYWTEVKKEIEKL